MGSRVAGPICRYKVGNFWLDGGTLCRTQSAPPGPTGAISPSPPRSATAIGTLDQFHAKIDGGDEAYKTEVERLLKRILLTKTGQAIALKIRTHGSVLIIPYPNMVNALTQPKLPGLSVSARWIALIHFSPNTRYDNRGKLKGSGDQLVPVRKENPAVPAMAGVRGRETTIPAHISGIITWPASAPDEILFHELVHAARFLGYDVGSNDEEEFFATLIANIYISEKEIDTKRHPHREKEYKAKLRGNYNANDSSKPLDESFMEPTRYLLDGDNYDRIAKFCRQHPKIAPMIADAPAKFNPIRDYYNYKVDKDQYKIDVKSYDEADTHVYDSRGAGER